MRIVYRSLRHPQPHERTIRPHALIQAGARWHLRAWCQQASEFRDFNLGRIGQARAIDHAPLPGPDQDQAWSTQVRLTFIAHESLTPEQKQLVRMEYMGGTSGLVHTVRIPLARYLIQSFRAAWDPKREPPPLHLLQVEDPHKLPEGVYWTGSAA